MEGIKEILNRPAPTIRRHGFYGAGSQAGFVKLEFLVEIGATAVIGQ